MGAFGLVELQCARQCLQNGLGHAPEVSSLQPCVVVCAHVGEESDLFAAWAGDATVAAEERQTSLLGVSRARREVRKSRTSVRLSMP